MAMVESVSRRSPVQAQMAHLNPVWGEACNMAVVLRFKDYESEVAAKQHLALADLTCLLKVGFKGAGTIAWLEEQGLGVPGAVYDWGNMPGGGLIIRTDRNEVFLEDGLRGQTVPSIIERFHEDQPDASLVTRQDASFLICGKQINEVLLQTCGVDFSKPLPKLVMSRVAGVSCSLLPVNLHDTEGIRLWLDPSYASYLWEELAKIIGELGGDCIGLTSIFEGMSDEG